MSEPLTAHLVVECIEKLLVAFPRTIGKAATMADVYRNGLRGLSGDGVRFAVDRIIQEDTYFPKVARIREVARAWEHVNRATIPQLANTDPLYCQSCRTRADYRRLWRPLNERHGRPAASADGAYLLLEELEQPRLLCKCGPPNPYAPIDGIEPAAMLLANAPPIIIRRAVKTTAVVYQLEPAV
jgi:hypothetical protein